VAAGRDSASEAEPAGKVVVEDEARMEVGEEESRCCLRHNKHYNEPASLDFEAVLFEDIKQWGITPLHDWMRVMEGIIDGAIKAGAELDGENPKEVKLTIQARFVGPEGKGVRIYFPNPKGGNSNTGPTARRFFQNPEITAKILPYTPKDLIVGFHDLLRSINSSKEQDIDKFRTLTRHVHKRWCETLGRFKIMTATMHQLLGHGHLYLQYAQVTLKIPNGILTEGSNEAANKINRFLRFFRSRKNGLANEKMDMMVRHLMMSDPHILAHYDMQSRAVGRIGKGNWLRD
jgi:hypothetical protein